jgi:hypothetical protein
MKRNPAVMASTDSLSRWGMTVSWWHLLDPCEVG